MSFVCQNGTWQWKIYEKNFPSIFVFELYFFVNYFFVFQIIFAFLFSQKFVSPNKIDLKN